MKISLERDALLAQLQTVSRVASTRSAIQALSGVQLSAGQDGCELRATDMDVGLRVPLEAEVTREGTVVLPARLMLDVVRSLPAAAVTLELRSAEQDVEIVSGNATLPHPHPARRGLPAVPRARARLGGRAPGRRVRRHRARRSPARPRATRRAPC